MDTLGIPRGSFYDITDEEKEMNKKRPSTPSPGYCPFRDGTSGSKTPYMPPGLQKTNTNSKKCKIRA